jgi:hypothetical protein
VLLSHNVLSHPSNADSESYIRAPHMLHLAYNICAGCLSQQGYFYIQLCIPTLQVHGLRTEWLISHKPQHKMIASVRSSKWLESQLNVEKQTTLGPQQILNISPTTYNNQYDCCVRNLKVRKCPSPHHCQKLHSQQTF